MGIVFKGSDACRAINLFMLLVWVATSGVMVSVQHMNTFIRCIYVINPLRFINEAFTRILTAKIPIIDQDGHYFDPEMYLMYKGYVLGYERCAICLTMWIIFAFILCCVLMEVNFRHV